MTDKNQLKLPDNSELAAALANIAFVVEATAFETQCLWEQHHKQLSWDSRECGFLSAIGRVDNRPVCLSLRFVKLDGHRVLFVHPTSQVVDYALMEAWLAVNCAPKMPGSTRLARADAQNFHQCLHAIRQLNELRTAHS